MVRRSCTNLSNVDSSNADNLGTWPNLGDFPSNPLSLLDVAADNAGIGTEVDDGFCLSTADIASTTSHKNYSVLYFIFC